MLVYREMPASIVPGAVHICQHKASYADHRQRDSDDVDEFVAGFEEDVGKDHHYDDGETV